MRDRRGGQPRLTRTINCDACRRRCRKYILIQVCTPDPVSDAHEHQADRKFCRDCFYDEPEAVGRILSVSYFGVER